MEFKATLISDHFKSLSATLDAFSHLGEIVSIEVHNEQFVLCTFNSSRTAQAVAHISRDHFKDYKLLRRGSPETVLRCNVSNKNFNSIFKKNLGASKVIKECQIQITQGNSNSEQHTESRIFMKLIYENGVTKKNTLWYYDGDPVALFYEKQYPNHLICHPLLLKGYLTRFDPRITDLAIICTPVRVILQSHWDTSISHTGEQPVKATFSINTADFDSYSLKKPVKLICNLREFKAIVDYMEAVDGRVSLTFDDMGMPILNKHFIQDKLLVYIALQTLPRHLYDNQSTAEESSYISINSNMDYSSPSNHRQTSSASSQHSTNNTHKHSNDLLTSPNTSNMEIDIRSSSEQPYRLNIERGAVMSSLEDTLPYVSPEIVRHPPESSPDYEEDEEPLFITRNVIEKRQSKSQQQILRSSSESSKSSNKDQRLTTLERLRLKKQQEKS